MGTPSYRQNANAKPLNKPMIEWFVEKTFHSKTEAADPRIN
jgi:acetyl esterase